MTLVSVVIPVYNRSEELRRALRSVRRQTHANWEAFVCDDGSEEDIGAVAASFADPRITHIRLPHSGLPAVPRNAVLRAARGELVAFLDSDDEWEDERLSRQIPHFEENPRLVLIGAGARVFQDGLPTGETLPLRVKPGFQSTGGMLKRNPVIMSSALIRRSALARAGLFAESRALRGMEDYEFFLRLGLCGDVLLIPEALVRYHVVPGSVSRVGALEDRVRRMEVLRHFRNGPGVTPADRQSVNMQIAINRFRIAVVAAMAGDFGAARRAFTGLREPTDSAAPDAVADDSSKKVMPTRRCVISGLFPPDAAGGAEAVAEAEAREACGRGEDVVVVATRPWDGWRSLTPRRFDHEGLRVVRFFPFNITDRLRMGRLPFPVRIVWHALHIANIHAWWTVRGLLRLEKPDHVSIHGAGGLGFLMVRAAKATGAHVSHRLHDMVLLEPFGTLSVGMEQRLDSAFRRCYQWTCRLLIGAPDEVVSPSRWLADLHTRRGFFPGSHIRVAPNPFTPLPACDTAPPSDGRLLIAYVGAVERIKGIVFLIKTLKNAAGFPFVLHVAGDGAAMTEVRRLTEADDRFVVCGRLDARELAAVLRAAHVVVIPSLIHENYPTVILEAQAAGVPVIASRAGGIPEMLPDECLFTPGDADDLLRRLKPFAERAAVDAPEESR